MRSAPLIAYSMYLSASGVEFSRCSPGEERRPRTVRAEGSSHDAGFHDRSRRGFRQADGPVVSWVRQRDEPTRCAREDGIQLTSLSASAAVRGSAPSSRRWLLRG